MRCYRQKEKSDIYIKINRFPLPMKQTGHYFCFRREKSFKIPNFYQAGFKQNFLFVVILFIVLVEYR